MLSALPLHQILFVRWWWKIGPESCSVERFCVGILKLFLGWNRQGNFCRNAMDWWHVVSKCLCVPVIWCLLVRKGSKLGNTSGLGAV